MKKLTLALFTLLALVGGLFLGWWVRDQKNQAQFLDQVLATERALSQQYAPVAYMGKDNRYASPVYLVSPASIEAGLTGMMVGNYQILADGQPRQM